MVSIEIVQPHAPNNGRIPRRGSPNMTEPILQLGTPQRPRRTAPRGGQYSEKFKSEMVRKMMGPSKQSANRLAQECGVNQATLSYWLRRAKVRVVTIPPKPAGRRPWSPEEKMRVVLAAASAGDSGRGALLRHEGLHDADLEQFQAKITEAMKSAASGPGKRNAQDKKRIKELERELRRKDKGAGARLSVACEQAGIDERTVQRWRGSETGEDQRRGPRTVPHNRLTWRGNARAAASSMAIAAPCPIFGVMA